MRWALLFTLLCVSLMPGTVWAQGSQVPGQQSAATPDPTDVVLARERTQQETRKLAAEELKLASEQEKLQQEAAALRHDGWNLLWSIVSSAPALAALIAAVVSFRQWANSRKDEQVKRSEERFQALATQLSSDSELGRASAAVGLRTYLERRYAEFHTQVFDLAVAGLRASAGGRGTPALVSLFMAACPMAREQQRGVEEGRRKGRVPRASEQNQGADAEAQLDPPRILLDASGIGLIGANLAGADFSQVSLQDAKCRRAILQGGTVRSASLDNADFRTANLAQVTCANTGMSGARLDDAVLSGMSLEEVQLIDATLCSADLSQTTWTQVFAGGTDFTNAKLDGATLKAVDFNPVELPGGPRPGRRANPEAAASMRGTLLQDVVGLTHDQLARCSELGAVWHRGGQPRPALEVSGTVSPGRLSVEASGLQPGEHARCDVVVGTVALRPMHSEVGDGGRAAFALELPGNAQADEISSTVTGLITGRLGAWP